MPDRAARLRTLFENDPSLPTFPESTRRVLDLLSRDDPALPDIAREVAKDPILALRVVKLANSAVYGLSRVVSSLVSALAVVGVSQIGAIVAGLASVQRCEQFLRDPHFGWKDFWGHCSGTAFIARSLAERLDLSFHGAEFLGGLLHDIGYLGLAKTDPERFRKAVAEAAEHGGFLSRSLVRGFGVSVEQAGDILADVSHLAPETRAVIRHLHDPGETPEGSRPLVAVVSLANELAHLAGLTFFRGTAEVEVVITALPAWEILAHKRPAMRHWDVARLVFELERDHAASQDFIQVSHSH